MKRKKRWLKIAGGLVVFLLIIDIIAGVFFYKLAIERGTKDFLSGNSDLEVSAETMEVFTQGDWRTWADQQPFEYWQMESFDGLDASRVFFRSGGTDQ